MRVQRVSALKKWVNSSHNEIDFSSGERNWINARIAAKKPIVVDLTPGILPFTG